MLKQSQIFNSINPLFSKITKRNISILLLTALFTACGSSSSSSQNDGEGDIDLKEYFFPKTSMTKTFSYTEREGEDVTRSHYDEVIEVGDNIVTVTKEGKIVEKNIITDKNITSYNMRDENDILRMFRHADLGDTIISDTANSTVVEDIGNITNELQMTCKLKSKETKFEKNDNVYTGDLLKIECITKGKVIIDVKDSLLGVVSEDLDGSHDYYDQSIIYLKKDLGMVASVDDNCIPDDRLPMIIDDRKSGKQCSDEQQYEYEFYLP